MDELMDFLARYVCNVHADHYLRKLLLKHPGCTYLDIITPSGIADVILVIKNSAHLRLFKLKPQILNSGRRKNQNWTDRQFFVRHFAQIEKEVFD